VKRYDIAARETAVVSSGYRFGTGHRFHRHSFNFQKGPFTGLGLYLSRALCDP